MRRVGRLAQRARGNERQPPEPRWRRRLRLALLGMAVTGAVVGLGKAALEIDLATHAAVAGGVLLDQGSRLGGLTIGEALCEGRERTSADAVAGILEPYLGRSTLLVDTEEVRAKLERLPWVREAGVARLLPGTLHVRLAEHEAVALWHDGQRTWLVGRDGSLLPVTELRAFAALKLLHGAGAPAASAALLDTLAAAPDLAKRVTAASRVAQRRWNVFLDGRIEVRLPEREAAPAWRRLAELERRGELTARAIETIDLRSRAWIAVRLKGEPKDLLLGRGA